jgi:hypothetical protein
MINTGILNFEYLNNFENVMFGQRVAYAIGARGVSKVWVADKLGISKQALNYLLKHSVKPKFVDEFSELLSLDPKWLETGAGCPVVSTIKEKVFIPSAIPIMTKLELFQPEKLDMSKRELIDFPCDNEKAFFAYKLDDDSSFPPFIEGSILIFDAAKQPMNEDYVLAIIEQDVFVRQYLFDNKNVCYKAGNYRYPTFINPLARLLGVLVEARYQLS